VNPLLDIQDLRLRYRLPGRAARPGPEVVRGVSFRIAHGGTFGLAGESGAGKSSLARVLVRLLEPSAGRVLLDGQDMAQLRGSALREARRRVQIIFQDPATSLSPRRSIAQTLLEPLQQFRPAEAAQHTALARQALAEVAMDADVLQRFPAQFSSGQRQRIAIARALLAQPDLLVADEAVSALDVSIQAQVLELLRQLRQRHGMALLFISHDLPVIRQVADTVGIMQAGRLVESGPVAEVFARPTHAHTQAMLAAFRLESRQEAKAKTPCPEFE
jgi:peptide/nickel transport system ATP-binding protein